MGREAIELFIRGQGTGDLGTTLTGEDDQCVERSESPVNSTIRTVFGTHRFQQFVYSEGPKTKVQLYPISARMQLPELTPNCNSCPILSSVSHDTFGQRTGML